MDNPYINVAADYYAVLGVKKDAKAAEIKKAWRALCMKNHPDRQPQSKKKQATEKTAEINTAYDAVSDPEKRKQYDASRTSRQQSPNQSQQSSYSQPGPTPSGGASYSYQRPQAGYTQTSYAQPGYTQPGYTQPGYSQTGYSQSGYSQSGYSQGGYSQGGHTQGGYGTSGYSGNTYGGTGPQSAYSSGPKFTAASSDGAEDWASHFAKAAFEGIFGGGTQGSQGTRPARAYTQNYSSNGSRTPPYYDGAPSSNSSGSPSEESESSSGREDHSKSSSARRRATSDSRSRPTDSTRYQSSRDKTPPPVYRGGTFSYVDPRSTPRPSTSGGSKSMPRTTPGYKSQSKTSNRDDRRDYTTKSSSRDTRSRDEPKRKPPPPAPMPPPPQRKASTKSSSRYPPASNTSSSRFRSDYPSSTRRGSTKSETVFVQDGDNYYEVQPCDDPNCDGPCGIKSKLKSQRRRRPLSDDSDSDSIIIDCGDPNCDTRHDSRRKPSSQSRAPRIEDEIREHEYKMEDLVESMERKASILVSRYQMFSPHPDNRCVWDVLDLVKRNLTDINCWICYIKYKRTRSRTGLDSVVKYAVDQLRYCYKMEEGLLRADSIAGASPTGRIEGYLSDGQRYDFLRATDRIPVWSTPPCKRKSSSCDSCRARR